MRVAGGGFEEGGVGRDSGTVGRREGGVTALRGEGVSSLRERRPLRVALLGHQFQVPSEGQAKAAALAASGGLELHVIVPDRYREAETRWRTPNLPRETPVGVVYHVARTRFPWSGPGKWYLQSYAKLGEMLCAIQPDILDVWEEPWNLLSAQACRIREKLLPAMRLVTETEQNICKHLPPPFQQVRRYVLQRTDFLIGRNAEAVAVARALGYAGPARVVGNGFDTGLFRPRDREKARRALGVEGFAVGYAGRWVESKGLETLVSAVEQLRGGLVGAGPGGEPRVWLAGEGPLGEVLRQRSARVCLVGSLAREELARFFAAMDVVVLPSLTTRGWKEQFGRVIVEAHGCETPVIGSSSGAIPEVLGDDTLLFPEGDSRALAALLARLQKEPERRIRAAQEGRERSVARYAWPAVAHQMREVYEAMHVCPAKRTATGPREPMSCEPECVRRGVRAC